MTISDVSAGKRLLLYPAAKVQTELFVGGSAADTVVVGTLLTLLKEGAGGPF